MRWREFMDALAEFQKLIEVSDTLMGDTGCKWDREQTFETLKTYLLEECYEVLDEVDSKNPTGLIEELGDLFYIIIFFAKVGEKEKKFSLNQILQQVREKLIYRHPHVFGDGKLDTLESIKDQWIALKEKEKSYRKSKLEGIPLNMPALLRTKKVLEKMGKPLDVAAITEEQLAETLFSLCERAEKSHINPELALSKYLKKKEEIFRSEEAS